MSDHHHWVVVVKGCEEISNQTEKRILDEVVLLDRVC